MLLYLESLGNPQRFGQIARRLTASKPIIAVKSGRTVAGRRAASSHTGALLEASEATVDALFDHAGVIRVETLDEQFDVAELLARQPLPRGVRVAIVTNAGGPAIACADACGAAGLRVEPLQEATRRALREHLPAAAAVDEPGRHARRRDERGLPPHDRAVAADPDVDAVIAIFIPALPGRGADAVLRAMRAAARREAGSRSLAVVMAPGEPRPARRARRPRLQHPRARRARARARRAARPAAAATAGRRHRGDIDSDGAP